jgi:glycosyltransferase involved in cell wall biosynthesis
MRIAWFTPFSKKSSIGRCSCLIAAELARYVDLDVWYPRTEDPRSTVARTVPFDNGSEIDGELLKPYDLIFYSFGNYVPYHRDIFEVSRRFPGIAVIHDFVMHHFFAGYYLDVLRSPDVYLAAVQRLYGASARARAADGLDGKRQKVWETDEVVDYPFFEALLPGCYGAVVHSKFVLERASPIADAPVRHLHLPHDVRGAGFSLDRKALGVSDDEFLMVTAGHVNPNKRVLEVIDVLGRNPGLTNKLVYAVVGPLDPGYQAKLQEAIRKYRLESVVRFTGYAPDETLHAYMRLADLCMNLRYPAMEGASGSAVEEMLHGKPIVVTRTGFYQELPDDCVWKIEPRDEARQLPEALERLRSNSALREALGARAREYAVERHNAGRYARDLMSFATEVENTRPMLQVTDRIGGELRRMGVAAHMPVVQSVARAIHELFGLAPESNIREKPGGADIN